MKGKSIVLIFSLISLFSLTLKAKDAASSEVPAAANPVSHQAMNATLEPYKEVQLKLKNMTKTERKAYFAEIKNQWSTFSPEQKQKIKQQMKSRLKNIKETYQPKE